jgi:hypothetical protein
VPSVEAEAIYRVKLNFRKFNLRSLCEITVNAEAIIRVFKS